MKTLLLLLSFGPLALAQTPTAQTPAAQTPTAPTPTAQTPTAQRPAAQTASSQPATAQSPAAPAMDFADAPSFTIAGVTDWTAVGGHGSDAVLKTSEELAAETALLKTSPPADPAAAATLQALHHRLQQAPTAALYEQAAALDEQAGDPFTAVQELQLAAQREPSEPNLFAWASELLQHRAILQAQQVFARGVAAFPASARMQAGDGAALFAAARYNEAAGRLCAAAALQPREPAFYRLLGEIQIAAPEPLDCALPTLARYATSHSADALPQYLYAMALLRSKPAAPATTARAEDLLRLAVEDDPRCGEAYLQLGTLAMARSDLPTAILDYQQTIAAQPQLGDAHYRLGIAYDRSGQPAKAQQEFARHDALQRQQAEATERQRLAVKQFVIAPQADTSAAPQ